MLTDNNWIHVAVYLRDTSCLYRAYTIIHTTRHWNLDYYMSVHSGSSMSLNQCQQQYNSTSRSLKVIWSFCTELCNKQVLLCVCCCLFSSGSTRLFHCVACKHIRLTQVPGILQMDFTDFTDVFSYASWYALAGVVMLLPFSDYRTSIGNLSGWFTFVMVYT